MRRLINVLQDVRGLGAIEYALVASLIAVAGIASFNEIGNKVDSQLVEVEQAL